MLSVCVKFCCVECFYGYLRVFQVFSTASFWFILGVVVSRSATKGFSFKRYWFSIFVFGFVNLLLDAPNNISQFHAFIAVSAAVVIGWIIDNRFNFGAKIFSEVGKYSYGIYLVHFVFLSIAVYLSVDVFKNISESSMFIVFSLSVAVFVFVTVASFYSAKLIYKYFELPFINFGKR